VSQIRTRRQPPRFRLVSVARVVDRSPHLVRVTLAGPELEGFDPGLPAASVRLLLPSASERDVLMPEWNGNEFLARDGSRPAIRTLTPRRFDPVANELDVEIVRHGEAPLSSWADVAPVGAQVAVSGTGRGYTVDPDTRELLLAGDESALPAISVLLEALPAAASVQVLVEVRGDDARVDLPAHPGASVHWVGSTPDAPPGSALVDAVVATPLGPDGRVWAAGEAAAVQRIRRHLFENLGFPRSRAVVRGYWKVGRHGDPDD